MHGVLIDTLLLLVMMMLFNFPERGLEVREPEPRWHHNTATSPAVGRRSCRPLTLPLLVSSLSLQLPPSCCFRLLGTSVNRPSLGGGRRVGKLGATQLLSTETLVTFQVTKAEKFQISVSSHGIKGALGRSAGCSLCAFPVVPEEGPS